MEVLIQFDLPKSPAGRRAMKLCRNLSGFSEGADGCQFALTAANVVESAQTLSYVWHVIQSRPGTILSINGVVRERAVMKPVIAAMNCLLCSGIYDNRRDYCCQFGVGIPSWGCRQLCSIARYSELQMRAERHWYQVGPFIDGIQWIDKHAIEAQLRKEAESKCLAICPHFDMRRAAKFVAALPEYIDPAEDTDWVLRYPLDPADCRRAIGVRPANTLDRFERVVRDAE